MTKLDTTVAFLEESAIWDDMDRANDITYYEVTARVRVRVRARVRVRVRDDMDRANDITYYEVAAWGRVGVRVRRACPDPPGEG